MTPRERGIMALNRQQPNYVPHFELQMQLTEEYFGKRFSNLDDWSAPPSTGSVSCDRMPNCTCKSPTILTMPLSSTVARHALQKKTGSKVSVCCGKWMADTAY